MRSNRNVALLFAAIAAAFVAIAIAGAFRAYSPVPYWDMWNGFLGFYVRVTNGDWSAWWVQHGDHRIVLARLFFWIDLAWFHGTQYFLLTVNYVLTGMVCLMFWKIWHEGSTGKYSYIALFMVAWLFSWSQNQNLIWGFQNEFILAQLLPLAAFYSLHRAVVDTQRSTPFFALAAVLGVLAVGSMINGILTLPLMTVYALLTGLHWRRKLLLATLSVVTIWLYFHDYRAHGHLGWVMKNLLGDPIGVAHYVLLYIGGPLYYITGMSPAGKPIAMGAASFFILNVLVFSWRIIPRARQASLPLALLFFIAYIGASAVATAGGRLVVGIDLALSSRYMTPALMAWAALLALYAPLIDTLNSRLHGRLWYAFVLMAAAMLPQQLRALASQQGSLFTRNVAALALELNIKDLHTIKHLGWSAQYVYAVAQEPRKRHLAIFGLSPYKEAGESINSRLAVSSPLRQCRGRIEAARAIPGEKYVAVSGWIYDPERHVVPQSLRLVARDGTVQGVAFAGGPRPDVARTLGKSALYAGFKGYVLNTAQEKPVEVVAPMSGCGFGANLPIALFSVSSAPAKAASVSISTDQIAPGNPWSNGIPGQSKLPGLTVFASLNHGETNANSLTLKVRRGDSLLYRSGRVGGRQTVTLLGDQPQTLTLPTALRWNQLRFSNERLPQTFELKFSDNGQGPGEWSAIAVKNGQ